MQAKVGMAGSTIYCIFPAKVVTRRLGGIPEHGQHLFHLILPSENQSEAKQWVGSSGLGFAD